MLLQIINSYYSNLVNIVYSFGGDIIKIAGDALYCVFMPEGGDLRGAVLCAALCSMQLRDVSCDYVEAIVPSNLRHKMLTLTSISKEEFAGIALRCLARTNSVRNLTIPTIEADSFSC